MTIYEKKAIELRYRGETYRNISKALGGKVSDGVLRQWFATDGKLYIPYLEYCSQNDAFVESQVRQEYKNFARQSMRLMRMLLGEALKIKDFKLALEIIKDINDRAGVVVVRKTEVNLEDKRTETINSYEQFVSELKRLGIDPRTGLRVAKAPVAES